MSIRRALLPSALLALLLVVVVLGGLTGLRNTAALLMLLWALAVLLRERRWPPLALPIAAWLLVAVLSASWALVASDALKAVLYDIVLPAGVFYGACLLCREPPTYRMSKTLIIAGSFIAAAFAVAIRAIHGVDDFPPTGLYMGVGVSSTMAVYALPFALLLATAASRRCLALGYFGVACVIVVGLASGNRMFWISAAAVALAFYAWQWRSLPRWQRVAAALLVAGIALMIVSFTQLTKGWGPFDIVLRDNRPRAWQEWAAIAAKAPLLGYGFGLKSVKVVGEERLPAEFSKGNPEMRFHSHNLLLNVVLQVGVVGLLAFLVLLGALLREAWRARNGPQSRAIGAALAGLVVAMLTKNMTDDFMHHAGVIAFWGYAGVLLGRLSGRVAPAAA